MLPMVLKTKIIARSCLMDCFSLGYNFKCKFRRPRAERVLRGTTPSNLEPLIAGKVDTTDVLVIAGDSLRGVVAAIIMVLIWHVL